MGIPKNAAAENKDAAWTVITYLTSKEWERYQTLKYQTDPTRNSTFFNPAMNKALPVPVDRGEGVPEGADPRDREHPGDVRADHRSPRRSSAAALTRHVERRRGRARARTTVDRRAQARRSPEVGGRPRLPPVAVNAGDAARIGAAGPASRPRVAARPCCCSAPARSTCSRSRSSRWSRAWSARSRTTTRGRTRGRWIGLANYSQLFHSSEFWTRRRAHRRPHRSPAWRSRSCSGRRSRSSSTSSSAARGSSAGS